NKSYTIQYNPPSGSPTTHGCFTGFTSISDSLVLTIPYTPGTWTVVLSTWNNNQTCSGSANNSTSRTVTVTSSNKLAITSVNGGADPIYGTAFSVVVQYQNNAGTATN